MTAFESHVLPEDWRDVLEGTFKQTYMQDLEGFLHQEIEQGKIILPDMPHWFAAFNVTPLNVVRVVILGQDPYPSPGHANGLCFSVQPQVRPLPKSLRNIYTELEMDLGICRENGDLTDWARQGVLLLNTVLTVEAGKANVHQGQGWERFTDAVIEALNAHTTPKIFILWGAKAQKKAQLIDASKHSIISSPHPSPLSAYRGFFGSQPFSNVNQILSSQGKHTICW